MKQEVLKMMRLIAVAAVVTIIIHSCKKESISSTENLTINENTTSAKFNIIKDITSVSPFNKRVGAPIDERTGLTWIDNYKKVHGLNKVYYLNSGYLQKILSEPNCVGICLYYAQDGYKKTHILPIGVNSLGKVIQEPTVSTSAGIISWATTQLWIANDKGSVNGHFFGSYTFDRLYLSSCEIIRVDFAIDDKNKPELLLTNACIFNLNTKAYEDRSYPCVDNSPSPNWN